MALRIEDVSPTVDRTQITEPPDGQSVSGRALTMAASSDGKRVYLGKNAAEVSDWHADTLRDRQQFALQFGDVVGRSARHGRWHHFLEPVKAQLLPEIASEQILARHAAAFGEAQQLLLGLTNEVLLALQFRQQVRDPIRV